MAGPEYTDVEKPFIDQLVGQGWDFLAGSVDNPAVTHRDSFAQVVMEPLLRRQLRAINLRDGEPWLDGPRLDQAVAAITRLPASKVLEANQQATELLLNGLSVDGLEGWDGGRGQTLRFIDWDEPANNLFTVVNQFKVKCPPGHDGAKGHVIPDLVLFVNGIPLVVVECKSRSAPEGLSQAVDQLRRYHDQRWLDGEVGEREGAPGLFATSQCLVASNFDDARVGTVGARFAHYLSWKTVAPRRESQVAMDLGVADLSAQQRLIAGMLTQANLLDIVRHYTLFMNLGGQTIKLVCRYQQFRGVTRAVERLKQGKTRREDGEADRRGGIVWHTQGSGKSLSMVFLVRKMRTDPALRRFKVVVITDRKDLQTQLSGTARLTGESVEKAGNTAELKKLLAREGPGLVFGIIQKYRDPDAEGEGDAYEIPEGRGLDWAHRDVAEPDPLSCARAPKKPSLSAPFEVLNTSEDILILVDEAHRTQAGDLHANMMRALPNAARIGFTGTPIIMGDKKRTHDIFGEYIDRYTIKESEQDGATVPILYEGRTAKGAIKDGASLDGLFEDLFRDHSPEELEAIKKKYATKGQIFEAPRLIREKAQDILRHYVTHILPNGYKAQLVAYSRRAALRYVEALEAARAELLEEALALSPEDKALDDAQLLTRPPRVKAAIQAWRHRQVLCQLAFAVVFSSGNNDDSAWAKWSDRAAVEHHIQRFKKPLPPLDGTPPADAAKHDPLAFLIVKSMLLTGFDAPIEGVMYLDRSLREAELLQAIARVNRTGHGKTHGIVVDYFGVANHLKEALAAYSEEDVEGALQSLKDEIPLLRDRHLRVIDVLRGQGVDDLDDTEEAVRALADERVRAEFVVKLKEFNRGLDDVLPRPEGLEFVNDAKRLAYIHALARNRYKDTPELCRDIGNKVRKLIDDYVISLGIDPRIPPVQLTDAEFDAHLGRQVGDRAKASEMEHAVRSHVRKHMDEDPVKYGRLSERLEELLQQLDGQWAEQVEALEGLIHQLRDGAAIDGEAIPDMPAHAEPFWRELVASSGQTPEQLDEAHARKLLEATEELVALIQQEIAIPDFWKPSHIPDQEALRQHLFTTLMIKGVVPFDRASEVAQRLLDLARSNHDRLMNA
ncbi:MULTISPECIES: type I restriction endonuclease subunit R [unclassified Ectothiorhodospira]|uniref:type I restriction endonuclease subunit R n=1 Tax=unclassified Ectothiorhodospira TaxID=2684909 RepID=UPI001EE8F5E8|nr:MULTISPECIES: type I restriction endonuclease subunit R [unclassified Ectothiorhodospira]MCG5517072.1 type I restriction endonuclease subunit R [Ectothiorhodospira sp. 9100]MCG5520066.1 type I restriction endonuclease subunit R [Ectothiorhodospira sp. 9905]